MKNGVPFLDGAFIQDNEGGRLLGNKCIACGRAYFPKVKFCFDCLAKDIEDVVLSRRGMLYSYTIGRMASTHFQPPYAVGLIDLPESIRVFAPLKLSKNESYRIGMEMEIYIDELWKEGEQQVIGYKFKPVV
ncbi:MAG: OB-fold domain-containing protein [Deltaproteobacteria bacterium]|nr:OB-fold domain-containing protein [Deltaproteobacteria bacterium]